MYARADNAPAWHQDGLQEACWICGKEADAALAMFRDGRHLDHVADEEITREALAYAELARKARNESLRRLYALEESREEPDVSDVMMA